MVCSEMYIVPLLGVCAYVCVCVCVSWVVDQTHSCLLKRSPWISGHESGCQTSSHMILLTNDMLDIQKSVCVCVCEGGVCMNAFGVHHCKWIGIWQAFQWAAGMAWWNHYPSLKLRSHYRDVSQLARVCTLIASRLCVAWPFFFFLLSWVFACVAWACVCACLAWRGCSPSANQRRGTDASACEKVEKWFLRHRSEMRFAAITRRRCRS